MKIYLRLFLLILIPVICFAFLVQHTYQKQLLANAERDIERELQDKLNIIAYSGISELPRDEFIKKIKEISSVMPVRITLIAPNGEVLADTQVARDDYYENHLDRPEIINLYNGINKVERRYSVTAGQEMIYYAKELNPGGNILRTAYPAEYVELVKESIEKQAYKNFILMTAILVIFLWYVSFRMSKPVVVISRIVDGIEKGRVPVFPDFQNRLMDRVAGLIHRTYNTLEKQKQILEAEKIKLSGLVNMIEEGIIKLDADNRVEIANIHAEHILNCKLHAGDNIMEKVKDMDSIVLAKEILSYTSDFSTVYELQKTVYEVYVRFLEGSRIIVLTDITGSERYATYKSELITNISHELKTPLALMMGYAETLIEHPDMKQEDRIKFLSKVFKGATQLNKIINDVIELHRYESSESNTTESEPIDLNEYVEELKDRYDDKFEPGLRFNVSGVVRINKAHLNSLLTNLIDNAIAYSGRDYIDIKMTATDDDFILEVADGGPPIPVEDRGRIFERFYTVSKSRNKNISSTGLGLSIVKHICRMYRGNINHEVNSRNGNSFKVRVVQPD
jgi:two-component system phosphate regulon sensor histidine kinase PhoR